MDHLRRAFLLCLVACLGLALLAPGTIRAEDEAGYEGDAEAAAEAFDEGEALREQGLWSDAADKYWEALEADLTHFRAHVRYQEAACQAGDDPQKIKSDIASFLEDWPSLKVLELHVLRIGTPPEGRLEKLAPMAKANPKDVNVLSEMGRAHLALNQPKEALGPLEKAKALAPADRRDITLMLVQALQGVDKGEDARRLLETGVAADGTWHEGHLALAAMDAQAEAWEETVQRSDVVLGLRPGTVAALLLKGEAQDRLGQSDEALKTLATARRVSQDDPRAVVAYADILARTPEGLEGAVGLYKVVLDKDDEDPRASYGMGWALERLEKYEDAEEHYRTALAVEPTSVRALNSIGFCLYKQGRIADAQVMFKRAIDLDKDFIKALLNLGATYDVQAKYKDAIKIYEGVLKQKEHKDNLRALVNCAFDHEALGAFPKALKLLERAHKVAPDDALICTWIGDNHYFQKKWKKASEWYTKAVALDDQEFFAWRGLGYSLGQRKQWEDALSALQKAKEINAEDLDVHLALGDIYLNETEDLEKALGAYQEYVQRGGDDPYVPELIQEIQQRLANK